MTLAGVTPAEQVAALGLAVGDTVEFSHKVMGKLIHFRFTLVSAPATYVYWARWDDSDNWECNREWSDFDFAKFTRAPLAVVKSSMPDPCAPLRAELREAYQIIQWTRGEDWPACVSMEDHLDAWLARNAGFGPGKEGA